MADELLFEIGTEEIPAGYIMPAIDSMKQLLETRLKDLGLAYGPIQTAATPRRLTICVADLAQRQPDRKEEPKR